MLTRYCLVVLRYSILLCVILTEPAPGDTWYYLVTRILNFKTTNQLPRTEGKDSWKDGCTHISSGAGLALSHYSKYVAVCTSDKCLTLWKTENLELGLRLGGESREFSPPVEPTRAKLAFPVELARVKLAFPINSPFSPSGDFRSTGSSLYEDFV